MYVVERDVVDEDVRLVLFLIGVRGDFNASDAFHGFWEMGNLFMSHALIEKISHLENSISPTSFSIVIEFHIS